MGYLHETVQKKYVIKNRIFALSYDYRAKRMANKQKIYRVFPFATTELTIPNLFEVSYSEYMSRYFQLSTLSIWEKGRVLIILWGKRSMHLFEDW